MPLVKVSKASVVSILHLQIAGRPPSGAVDDQVVFKDHVREAGLQNCFGIVRALRAIFSTTARTPDAFFANRENTVGEGKVLQFVAGVLDRK